MDLPASAVLMSSFRRDQATPGLGSRPIPPPPLEGKGPCYRPNVVQKVLRVHARRVAFLKPPIRVEQNPFAWWAGNLGADRPLGGSGNDRGHRREDTKSIAHTEIGFHGCSCRRIRIL